MTPTDHAIDAGTAVVAVSAPSWIPLVHSVNEALAFVLTCAGLVLVFMRIKLSLRELKKSD